MNSVNLIGNLTREVELKHVGEAAVAKFGVAVNERVKKNGEWTDVAYFFDVETWNGAEACAKCAVHPDPDPEPQSALVVFPHKAIRMEIK